MIACVDQLYSQRTAKLLTQHRFEHNFCTGSYVKLRWKTSLPVESHPIHLVDSTRLNITSAVIVWKTHGYYDPTLSRKTVAPLDCESSKSTPVMSMSQLLPPPPAQVDTALA